MKKGLLAGTALAAIGLALTQQPVQAATLDDVMARLDACSNETMRSSRRRMHSSGIA
ncbi:hypothetical protein ACVWY2_001149 [Bradyrhizobium sp. JR6.1]